MTDDLNRLEPDLSTHLPRRAALRHLGAGGLGAGLLLHALSGSGAAQSAVASAATEAAARRAINAINQALSTGDLSVLNLSFAPSYVNRTPARSFTTSQSFSGDLAGLGNALTGLRGIVPNAKFLVEDVVASGDTAAVRVEFRGDVDTSLVTLPAGVAPRLLVGGIAMARFENGLVVESWQYDDAAAQFLFAPQTATPTPAPATATPTPAGATPGEARNVSDFNAIQLQGVGQMQIVQGDQEYLTIDAEEKVRNRISSEVRNGTLVIEPARDFRTDQPIVYYVGVKTLGNLSVGGSGQAVTETLTADELILEARGTSGITIASLTATALQATLAGNSKISLAGSVERQDVTLQGTSVYDAGNLVSADATVTTSDTAQAVVQANATLTATASGVSKIVYSGDAAVTPNTSGVASITQAG
jgi:predicted ester cyclase